ncbi:hypothetical protein [Cupriavidus sp. D39]|uniref:hypothetical protein n=1 Tax=Cupriavidus sp. D39 TaxID=2997877 RepID=UPI0022713468|nr:hypothetical protein [Cupriavidus sp. D39]MCY0858788.1 hypothetical protein [Cupriavidus sp. D39]
MHYIAKSEVFTMFVKSNREDFVRDFNQIKLHLLLTMKDSQSFDRSNETASSPFDRSSDRAPAPFDRSNETASNPFNRPSDYAPISFDRSNDIASSPFDRSSDHAPAPFDRSNEIASTPFDRPSDCVPVPFDRSNETPPPSWHRQRVKRSTHDQPKENAPAPRGVFFWAHRFHWRTTMAA